MIKEKRSFLERLTGSKNLPEDAEQELDTMNIISEDEESELTLPQEREESTRTNFNVADEENWDEDNDGEGQLTIDVFQTDSDIVVKSTIAGVKPEDLEVSINNDMLTIKGERRLEEEVHEENYYYQECYWGAFSRSVVLPVDVVTDKIEASLKNGILTIRLPKADKSRVKKIQVRGF